MFKSMILLVAIASISCHVNAMDRIQGIKANFLNSDQQSLILQFALINIPTLALSEIKYLHDADVRMEKRGISKAMVHQALKLGKGRIDHHRQEVIFSHNDIIVFVCGYNKIISAKRAVKK